MNLPLGRSSRTLKKDRELCYTYSEISEEMYADRYKTITSQLPVCVSIYLSACLSVYIPLCLSVCLHTSQPAWLVSLPVSVPSFVEPLWSQVYVSSCTSHGCPYT